ncbi:MAG TPA: WXG100 family type VII secretion target [Ilumatobacteraceae bacterium]|nr:WXG100 family type VII secretion target [Ilumatobacteraceae bacterium]
MSGEILLRAEDARSAADAVKNAAQDALDQFNALKGRLAPLGDSFRGRTADKWDEKYTDWDTSAKDLMDALDGLGQFLSQAADAIEQTDSDLAGQL